MAYEKVNRGPEEVNAAEPSMAEPEPESSGGDTMPQVDSPEPEPPDMVEAVVEDAPAQMSLLGEDGPTAERPEMPEPRPLARTARWWCLLKKSVS